MKRIFLLSIFISSILLSVCISSCLKEDVPFEPVVNSAVFDSLQGDYRIQAAVLAPKTPTAGFPITIINAGTFDFNPDLTGTAGMPPMIPVYNFTYQLPDDFTLIINTNPAGTPSYDTNFVSFSGGLLYMTIKRKQITYLPTYNDVFYMHYILGR